jgi:hypothetical protein
MYYLVKTAPGTFENAWSLDPKTDFLPENFFGLAKDLNGLRLDGSLFDEVDGQPVLNLERKAQADAVEAAIITKQQAAESAKNLLKDKFKALKKSDIDTVSELGDALLDLLKVLDLK